MIVPLLGTTAHADISVRAAVNPQRVQVGEPVSLTIDINGAQDVPPPSITNLNGFDVRYVGPSTQISIVNGHMSASVQHRYSLLPLEPGRFPVGPFSVDYQGQHYQTASFTVEVVGAGQPPVAGAQAQQGQPAQRPSAQQQAAPQAGPRSLRLTLVVPQTEVYLHERIPVDVTLYVGNTRVGDLQYPTVPAEGLSLDKFAEPSQRQEVIDGETFQVLHFQTTAIPMRAGTLTLGPVTLSLNIYSRRRDSAFNDPFFERFFQNDPFSTDRHPYEVRADPVALNVLPLPDQGKPATFSGAVGHFTMQVDAAPAQLTAGDPLTVRINLTGSGNLGDAAPPQLTSVEGFRTYEPHVTKSDNNNRSFEQVLIPNDATVRAVPPVQFSYFDPRARRYQTLESQPVALVVRAPQNAPRSEVMAGGAPAPRSAPAEKLGRDIVYIKDDPGHLVHRDQPWYGGVLTLLWQPVPLLLLIAALWYDRRRQRLSGDIRYARFTRAGKDARRGLAAAERALAHGDRQAFYDALSRTMQEYLAAKLDLPPGGIDADTVARRGVAHDCVQHIRDFLTTCEQVRFAPAAGDGDMRGTLALAQDVIKRLERNRRLSPLPLLPSASPGERRGESSATQRDSTYGVVLLLIASLATTARAVDAPASPQTTFFHANALYKDGQYAAAATEYEQLLQSGAISGNVYFNLGNAYVKAGEKGKAILNYERARRFMPSDPDVAANLGYAQSLTGAEACVPPLWQRLVFPLAQRFATGGLFWLTSGAYTFLMLALAAYRLWPRRPRWLLYSAGALAVLVVIATTSLAQQLTSEEWQRQAVVIAEGDTAARFEPATNGTVHFALKEGSHVHILDSREGWLQVARCDGRRGWIPKSAVEEL
jgi:tetratricopeptide (TPR) repeat protein